MTGNVPHFTGWEHAVSAPHRHRNSLISIENYKKYTAWHSVLTHEYKPAWFWLQQLGLVSFKTRRAFKNNGVLSSASAPHHQTGLGPRSSKQTKLKLWVSEFLAWPMVSSCFRHLRTWCCWEECPWRMWWKQKGVKAGEAAKGTSVLWALWICKSWEKNQAMHSKLFIDS